MNFVLKPSLEHIALVKIVVSLWNQNDVMTLMVNLRSPLCIRDEEWQKIEDRVIEKVPQLLLPELLKETLISFVKPIGLQIFKWMQHVCKVFDLHVDLVAVLCWTSQGTIDRKKTAEVLITYENLDILKRFIFASIYCLEDSILELWKKMPQNLRASILKGEYLGTRKQNLVYFWAHSIQKGCILYKSIELFSHHFFFESSATAKNRAATEYFLRNLTPREREKSLVRTAKRMSDADVLYFLLLQMDTEQQTEALKCIPYKILLLFLDWPYQAFFTETTKSVWEFLCEFHYVDLIQRIVGKINRGFKDWNYEELLVEFLQKIPNTKITTSVNPSLMRFFYDITDRKIMSLFLQYSNHTLKQKLAWRNRGRDLCELFMWFDRGSLLEIFIQGFWPPKDEVIKLKMEFEMSRVCYSEDSLTEIEQQWDKLLHLYDD